MHAGVPVNPGVTWTTATTGVSAVGTIGVLGLFLRMVGPWRKQTTDAETKLREELMATNTRLEERITKMEVKFDRAERRHDTHLDIITQLHSAEIAAMRHRLGNEVLMNSSLLAAIRAGTPEKLGQVVTIIEADRARREENISAELAALVKLRAAALDKIEKLRAED